jgi:hypothetical protein
MIKSKWQRAMGKGCGLEVEGRGETGNSRREMEAQKTQNQDRQLHFLKCFPFIEVN